MAPGRPWAVAAPVTMSYVLHVWDGPEPTSVQGAADLLAELTRRAAPPNPKLVALASRLTERLSGSSASAATLWPEGPPTGHSGTAVVSLPVPPAVHAIVGPVLLQAARDLGLVVFDEQAGQVHLPSGRLLSLRPPGPPNETPVRGDALQSKQQVQALCLQAIEPGLSAAGFRTIRSQSTFSRSAPMGTAEAVLDVTDYAPVGFDIVFNLSLRPAWPEAWSALARDHGADACLLNVAALARRAGLSPPGTAGSEVSLASASSIEELQALNARWDALMRQAFVPLCMRCEDLRGLEREFNAEDSPFRPMPVGLLLAAAAGRDDLPLLTHRYAERVPQWFRGKVASLGAALGG